MTNTTVSLRPHQKIATACWALIKSLLDDGRRPSSLDDAEMTSACAGLIEIACDSAVKSARNERREEERSKL